MKRCLYYLLLLPPVLVCAAAVCLSHAGSRRNRFQHIRAETEDARCSYLASKGLAAELVGSRAVTVPSDHSGAYADYAALQAQLQLPLAEYAGQRAVLYTYRITGSEPPLYAELLTAEGCLIGVQCYYPDEGMTLDLQGNPIAPAQ